VNPELLRMLANELRAVAVPIANAAKEKLKEVDHDPLGHVGLELARAVVRGESLDTTEDVARVVRDALNDEAP